MDKTGANNPNWKGGLIEKCCEVCNTRYKVKPVHRESRFCSLQCVGFSQRGVNNRKTSAQVEKACEVCRRSFSVYRSHAHRQRCCSRACSFKWRASANRDDANPNWRGGLSRMPYPHNWREISKRIRERDGNRCMNPYCESGHEKIDAHHIDFDKFNVAETNLIALCTVCNSKANYDREGSKAFYSEIAKTKIAADMYPFEFIALSALVAHLWLTRRALRRRLHESQRDAKHCRHMWHLADECAAYWAKKCGVEVEGRDDVLDAEYLEAK